jgi:NADPH2:quinone reductase
VEVSNPGPGQALLRHTAIGVNFTDIHHRSGRYPGPGLPMILGMEAAGVVEEIGANAGELSLGDRVVYGGATPSLAPGAYCERRVMPAERLVRIPDWMDDETAAAVFLKGLTAQYLLKGAYPLRSGETALVHAAAGGVGVLLCQWARHLGAQVLGAVSSPAKADLARANGCHHVVVLDGADTVTQVHALTDGRGVDVVYDSVGAATFEMSLASLRRRGMLVSFGSASGPVPPLELFRLNRMGSLFVTSAGFADYTAERAELLERAADLFEVIRSGAVRVAIHQRYPLAEAERAHRDLQQRRTTGSSILLP